MTWTYNGDPSESPEAEVHFLLGDTDTLDQQITDEEISFALTQSGQNTKVAAILCCRVLMAKAAKKVDYKLGPETVNASDRYDHYAKLYKELVGDSISSFAAPSADIPTTGNVFSVGLHDNHMG